MAPEHTNIQTHAYMRPSRHGIERTIVCDIDGVKNLVAKPVLQLCLREQIDQKVAVAGGHSQGKTDGHGCTFV